MRVGSYFVNAVDLYAVEMVGLHVATETDVVIEIETEIDVVTEIEIETDIVVTALDVVDSHINWL